jgi:hypothetical protein
MRRDCAIISYCLIETSETRKGLALLLRFFVASLLIIGANAAHVTLAAETSSVTSTNHPIAAKAQRIPISWQITRSQFKSSGAATLSESFREVWSFEGHGDGPSFLVSPRARVAVVGSPTTEGVVPSGADTVRNIVIDEFNLAKLLGVIANGADLDPQEVSQAKLISINFSNPPKNGENLILHLSEDVHYEVHLEVGKQ